VLIARSPHPSLSDGGKIMTVVLQLPAYASCVPPSPAGPARVGVGAIG
jgi:hypothetical protein